MRGDSKISLWYLVRAHRQTLVNDQAGEVRLRDHLLLEGVPLALLIFLFAIDVKLGDVAAGALISVSGLLAAFLFGAMLQVSQRAMDWSDGAPEPGPATSSHATFLEEIAANAGYAAVVCLFAAVAYVAAIGSSGWLLRLFSAIGLALGLHMLLVLLMVMKRVFAMTQERLIRARTGADRETRRFKKAS